MIDEALISAQDRQDRSGAMLKALHKTLDIFAFYNHAMSTVDEILSDGIWPVADVADIGHVSVYRVFEDEPGSRRFGQVYRWSKADGGSTPLNAKSYAVQGNPAVERWLSALSADECVFATTGDLAELDVGELELKALVSVPIFSDGRLWGAVNFEDFARERSFDDEIIALLRSAARMYAELIIRTEKAREADAAFAAYKRDSEASSDILQALLNGLDVMLLATVPETGEIVYVNDQCKEFFGAGEGGPGEICYEFMHGRTERCEGCPNELLAEDPGRVIQWELFYPEKNCTHRLTSLLIDWPGGKKAQLDFGIDITETVRHRETLENILNNLDAIILATVPETGEILFVNDENKRFFGVEGKDGAGIPCYKFLHGREERCAYCPYFELEKTPESVVRWIPFDPHIDRVYSMSAMLIDWPGGKKAHLEFGVDVTEGVRSQETLEKILDTLDSYVYVTDPETDEILYINEKMKAGFHVDDSAKGGKCWQHMQTEQTGRCDFCRKPELLASPGESVVWEDDNPISKSILLHIDRIIDWPGGRKVHMQQSIDITETKRAQAALEQREKMLDALNNAAITLLMRRDEALVDAMTRGVSLIAEALNIDRVSVSRNTEKSDGLYATQVYRWSKEKEGSLEPLEELRDNPYARQIPRWRDILSAGGCINGLLRHMPEYETLKHFNCRSVLAIPVFNDNRFWGFALYEDRVNDRVFTEDEIEIMRSAGLMLANVVMRDEEAAIIRQASEHAKLMLDATPLGVTLWSRDYRILDCNEALVRLFGLNSREEWADRFLECCPEYQPGGQPTNEIMYEILGKAFRDGFCVFEFTHQALDQTPIPSEITLVRVKHGNQYVVAAYVRDLREHKRMMREIEMRSRLLRAENALSAILLQTDIDRFEADLMRSMGLLAEAAKTDRVYVWENYQRDGQLYCAQIYEWSENVEPQQEKLSEARPFRDVVPWWDRLMRGKCVNGLVRDMDEKYREMLELQCILSVLLVPIFLKNQLWGFIGFDDCHSERVFTANEEMVLQSASNLIANALVRNDEAAAVRQANEYVKLMLDSSPLGCVMWSHDSRVIGCNEAFVTLFGYESIEQAMERVFDCSAEYQSDGQRSDIKVAEMLQKAGEEGRCVTEWMHQTLDGTPVPAEATFVRVNMGENYVVVTYSRDLREYKRMMEEIDRQTKLLYATNRMSTILLQSEPGSLERDLNSAMGVLAEAADADRAYVWKNHTENNQTFGSQIYGWSRGDDPHLRDQLIFGANYADHAAQWPQMFTKNICINSIVRDMTPYVQNFLKSQGTKSLLMVPIFFKGEPWGFIGFDDCRNERIFSKEEEHILRSASELIADILFRNEMEENLRSSAVQLQTALTAAQSANRAKSEFLSRMSHEMRTPMNAIVGMTNIAQGAEDIEKKDACLEKIDGASKHLLSVINDVLDMSKIEANKFELSPQPFNFEKMLINVTNVINFRVDEKKQLFRVDIDKDIPSVLIGDEFRLTQVITNLLANAVKFTPEGGSITLNAKCHDFNESHCNILIEVVDTGIGISQEHKSRLFDAFEQADGGTARKFGGTGLGLAISKHIVELMGGNIWVESELESGAKFAFTVKLQRSEDLAVLPRIDRERVEILAVDDAKDIREYFIDVMNRYGFNCGVAASGGEALEMIRNKQGAPYNIFFIDWIMPEMDGIELTRRIKAIARENSVIIMISGAEWSRIAEEGKQAGVDRFISKPLFPSTLISIIEDCIRLKEGAPADTEPDSIDNYSGRSILVAEDVDVNQEIITAVLDGTFIEIDFAENGLEAVRMFEAAPQKYSLILMDVQMPELDGYDATRMIRALPCPEAHSVPIIAMTANVFKEDVETCLAVGMDDHLGKPIDIEALLEKLRKYI